MAQTINARLAVVTPGAAALTLAEAKSHLRIDTGFTADDAWITAAIAEVQNELQERAGIQFTNTTLNLFIQSEWPARGFELPRGNVISVLTVEYIAAATLDGSYTVLSVANWRAGLGRPGLVAWKEGAVLPALNTVEPWPIKIQYQVGYSTVPDAIKAALRCRLAQRSIDREGDAPAFPYQIDSLMTPYAEWQRPLLYEWCPANASTSW